MPRMTDLPNIPQTPDQGAFWNSGVPFATSPAAAHAMLHPDRVQGGRWSVVDYMAHFGGRNNPYYLMQKYWPAGADQAQALRGLGADEGSGLLAASLGVAVGAALLGVGLSAATGYYVGKAVAPDDGRSKSYGIIGVAVGILSAFSPEPVTVPAAMGVLAAATNKVVGRLWTKIKTSTGRASSRAPRGTAAWKASATTLWTKGRLRLRPRRRRSSRHRALLRGQRLSPRCRASPRRRGCRPCRKAPAHWWT